jgi:hypothetical protein
MLSNFLPQTISRWKTQDSDKSYMIPDPRSLLLFLFLCVVLVIKLRASRILDKHSDTEL